MSSNSMLSKLLIIPPIAIGAGLLWYAGASRPPPEQAPVQERATSVRVLTLAAQDVEPALSGFGAVKPENVWTGIAQVSGRIAYLNPAFRRGAALDQGTELVRISPVDYQLAVAEAQAQIRSAESKLAELVLSEQNTSELLKIEQQSLALKQKSVDAKRALLQRGNIAQLSFDAEMRDLLSQKKRVQDLNNTLRLMPAQRAVQQEQIRVNRAKLETAKLNLGRTSIKLPFAARIASVDVEVSQFLQTGAKIGTADGIATAEIVAQYPLDHLRAFVDALKEEFKPEERNWKHNRDFAEAIGMYAVVKLRSDQGDTIWRGRVVRSNDALNEQTRTVGLIVLVDKPYANAKPGERPPLVKGMFVEVVLRAKPLKSKLVVPQSAIHDGRVYVLGAGNRLVIKDVTVGYSRDDFATVRDGLIAGDRIVVTDLIAAQPGMLLAPVEDDALKVVLAGRAAEKERVR